MRKIGKQKIGWVNPGNGGSGNSNKQYIYCYRYRPYDYVSWVQKP